MDKSKLNVMNEHSVLTIQSKVTLCICLFGTETKSFMDWVMEEVLQLGQGELLFEGSDVLRLSIEKDLEGTGFKLSEWGSYSELMYTFDLPLNGCAGEETKKLEKLVFDSVKKVIERYQLETFWPVYSECNDRIDVMRNDKGILDLTDVHCKKSNTYKIHAQLCRVYTYLGQRLARRLPLPQSNCLA